MYLGSLAKFYREKMKFEKLHGLRLPKKSLFSEFGDWKKYRSRQSPLEDRVPWITFGAATFLKDNLRNGMKAFEWGMGGSSAFLLDIGLDLVSVEHDAGWFEKARKDLGENEHWKPKLVEPTHGREPNDPSDWSLYGSSDPKFLDASFEAYARSIDEFEDQTFDVILVDGRCRPSCFHHALKKVRSGGYVLWDNTDRASYHPEMESVDPTEFKMFDFPGPSPYVTFFTRTTIWQRQS